MPDIEMLKEMGVETRDNEFSANSWHGLNESEREEFAQMYETEFEQADYLTQAQRDAIRLRLNMNDGLLLSTAFSRYIEGQDQWVR
jgi:hypothetical protein